MAARSCRCSSTLDAGRRSRSTSTADRTRMIRAAIADVQFTMLVITIGLVVLVIALFLGASGRR